jgi:hypothetical protein
VATRSPDATYLLPSLRASPSSDAQGAPGVAAGARATSGSVDAKDLSDFWACEPTGIDPKGRSVQRHLSLAGMDVYEQDRRASLSRSSQECPSTADQD